MITLVLSVQSFNSICSFEWAKNCYVAELSLVRRVRRETAANDVILVAEFESFDRFMCAETVTDQDSWSMIRTSFCLRIKYMLYPVQADVVVGIPSLGAGKMPSRSGVSRPVAPVCGCWPDDEWMERPTICRDTFD
jgi:hypothetical protein